MTYRPEQGSSFLLIPRDGGKIRRIEHEAVLQFHLSNAYDDRGDVVVDVITYGNGDLLDCIARFRTSPMDRVSSEFTRFRITADGRVLAERLSDATCNSPASPRRGGTAAPLRLRQHQAEPGNALRRDHQTRPVRQL